MSSKPQDYKSHFTSSLQNIKQGPSPSRLTNDIICFIIFIVIVLGMLVLGIWMMAQQSQSLRNQLKGGTHSNTKVAKVFTNYYGVISLCLFFGLIFAVLYVILVQCFPKCMVFTLIIMVFCVLFAVLVFAIVQNNVGLIIAMVLIIVFFGIFLCCIRKNLSAGIKILQLATRFVQQRPSVYLSSLWVFFLSISFLVFWVISFIAVQLKANTDIKNNQSTTQQNGIMFFFVFTFIFMTIFLYYVLSYHIATSCALWFYDVDGNYCSIATCNLTKYHVGSLTFGALIVTVIKMLRMILGMKDGQSQNVCVRGMQCLVGCVLGCLQNIIQVMNSVAIVTIAVTGQSYCDSIKTAVHLILDNMGIYSSVSLISNLLMFGGLLSSIGLSTLIAILYTQKHYASIPTQQLDQLGIIIFFVGVMVVLFVVGVLGQALQSVFVLWCLGGKLSQGGVIVPMPDMMKEIKGVSDREKDKERQRAKEKQKNNASAQDMERKQ